MQTSTNVNHPSVTSGTIVIYWTIMVIVFMVYEQKLNCNSSCGCYIGTIIRQDVTIDVIRYNLIDFANLLFYHIIIYYSKLDSVGICNKDNQMVRINITNVIYSYLYDDDYIRYENDLRLLNFSRFSLITIRIFHNYCITVDLQDSIYNSLFSKYMLYAISKSNIIHRIFRIDSIKYDVSIDHTENLTYIKLCNNTFDNCRKSTKMWILTDKSCNEFDGNNCNLAILLSIKDNILYGSVLDIIFGTQTTLPNPDNDIYYHNSMFELYH